MLSLKKFSSRGTILALASLFIVVVFALPASAFAAVQLNWSMNPDGTNANFSCPAGLTSPLNSTNGGGGPASRFDLASGLVLSGSPFSFTTNFVCNTTPNSVSPNIITYLGLDSADPVGNYYIFIDTTPTVSGQFDFYYELFWNGSSAIYQNPTATSTVIYGSGYSNIFNTRFLSSSLAGNDTSLSLSTTYYHDTQEFDNSNRPDTLLFTVMKEGSLLSDGDTQYVSAMRFLLPLSTGTTTKSFTYNSANFLNNVPKLPSGNYTAYVNFWNALNQYFVFERTSVSIRFNISNNGLLSVIQTNITNGLNEPDAVPSTCSFNNFSE